VSASLVFLWQNYSRWRKAATSLASLAILLAVVSGPLSGSMGEFILEKQIDSQIAKLWQRYPQYREVIQLKNLRVQSVHNKGVTIDFQLYAPAALLEEKFLDRLNAELIQVLQNNGPGFAGQDWGDGRMSVRFMAAAAPAGGAAAPLSSEAHPGHLRLNGPALGADVDRAAGEDLHPDAQPCHHHQGLGQQSGDQYRSPWPEQGLKGKAGAARHETGSRQQMVEQHTQDGTAQQQDQRSGLEKKRHQTTGPGRQRGDRTFNLWAPAVDLLRGAHRLTRPGQRWQQAIEASANVGVCLLSCFEIALALQRGRLFFPVL
jgi:hypothetical protein